MITDLESGATRKLVEHGKGSHSAVWSPDGATVAFSAWIGDRRYHLFTTDRHGSEPRPLTDAGARPLQWSRDGRWLYYVEATDRPRREDVLVMNREGTVRRPVLPVPSSAFRASPDSRWAAYLADFELAGGRSARWLCTTRLDPGTGTAAGQDPGVRIARGVSGFDWSPDASSLVFTSGREMAVARADGSDRTVLLDLEVGDRVPLHANWSPDGRAIAFVEAPVAAGAARSVPEVWVMGADGAEPRYLGDGLYPHWFAESTPPAWAPW